MKIRDGYLMGTALAAAIILVLLIGAAIALVVGHIFT
jgi:hypothetical protein